MDKKYSLSIIGLNTHKIINQDEYLKQEYKQLERSLRTVFGIIDAEAKRSRSDMMLVAFLNSVLYNVLKRAQLFEHGEEAFIKLMLKMYHTYQNQEVFKKETVIYE